MIRSFSDSETKLIFLGFRSRKLPFSIQNVARRKLKMVEAAKTVEDLHIPPGNHFEKLIGKLEGYYSIRINDQWRIIFTFSDGGAENVRITDYHK